MDLHAATALFVDCVGDCDGTMGVAQLQLVFERMGRPELDAEEVSQASACGGGMLNI